MTIEEAIQHAREVALSNAACSVAYRKGGKTVLADCCDDCAAEHEQLAKWLTELKQRREAEITAPPKSNGDKIRAMDDEELAEFLRNVQIGALAAQFTNTGIDSEEKLRLFLAATYEEEENDDER